MKLSKIKSAHLFLFYSARAVLSKMHDAYLSFFFTDDYFVFIKEAFFGLTNSSGSQIVKLKDETQVVMRPGTYDASIISEVFFRKAYDKYLGKNLTTVVDLGAQIGTFSLRTAKLHPSAKIVAVEAASSNFSLLVENLSRNAFARNVEPLNKAIWSNSGEKVSIALASKNSGGNSIVFTGDKTKHEIIETVSLEKIFRDNSIERCDLLKIDIEGAEYQVLYSLSEEMFSRIRSIVMEAHPVDSEKNNIESLARFLREKGFAVSVEGRYLFADRS